MAEVAELKARLPAIESEEAALGDDLSQRLALIPNLPADDVPEGESEADNVEVARWGTPRTFDFTPREHADIAPALGMDFETGARCPALASPSCAAGWRGCTARSASSCSTCRPANMATSNATRRCWSRTRRCTAPTSCRSSPRNSFRTTDGRWLIPTSEVSLTASVMGELLDEAALPVRLTALTLCFRSEAGSAGRDTRGFIRQHQFEKCELVSDRPPGGQRGRTRSDDARGGDDSRTARPAVSQAAAVHRRHGVRRAQDLRSRSLAARPGRVAGNQFVFEHRRLPGAPDEHALPARRGRRSRASSTRSTARALRSGGRWWRCWRITSRPTDRSRCRRCCSPIWAGSIGWRRWRERFPALLPCKGRCARQRDGGVSPSPDRVTPLRQAFGLPPPLAGEDLERCASC